MNKMNIQSKVVKNQFYGFSFFSQIKTNKTCNLFEKSKFKLSSFYQMTYDCFYDVNIDNYFFL